MTSNRVTLAELKAKSPKDLLSMAEELEIENASTMRKGDMMFSILKERAEDGAEISGDGVLEVLQDGFGFLRSPEANYLPGPDDIYVSPEMIRQFSLRTGDTIEGLTTNCVYPNGISTSLPEDVQEAYVRSIQGLENVEIQQPGYAIEYDFLNPQGLSSDLESNLMGGLFLAGQINGTTGYEEAAAQGLVAAIGVAKRLKGVCPITFDRSTSYIGVMIDDLTTRGATEPYRMFTSRAEFRLKLRADNADQRLTEQGHTSGLVSGHRYGVYQEKMKRLDQCRSLLSSMSVSPNQARQVRIDLGLDGRRRNGHELLSIPGVTIANLADLTPKLAEFDTESLDQAAREALYVTYIERQGRDIEALARDLSVKIPNGFHYAGVAGLSSEMIAKLSAARPASLGAAKNIEGVTPAALTAVLLSIKSQSLKNTG